MGSSTPNMSSNNIEHLWKPCLSISNIPGIPTLYNSSLNNSIEGQSYMVPLYASTVKQQEQIYQKRKIPFPHLVGVYNSSVLERRVNCMIETTFHVITERIHYRLSNLPKNSISCQQGMYILSCVIHGFKTIYCPENICYITDNMIGIKMDGAVKVWLNENWGINFPVRRIHSEHLMIDQIINVIESYIKNKDGFGNSFTIKKQQLSPLTFTTIQQLLEICHFSSQNAKSLLQSHFVNDKSINNSYPPLRPNDQIQPQKYNPFNTKSQKLLSNQINIPKNNDMPHYLLNTNKKIQNKSQISLSIKTNNKLVDRSNYYYPIKNDAITIKHVNNNNCIKKQNFNSLDFNTKLKHTTTKHSNLPQNYQKYRINLKQNNHQNHQINSKVFPLTTRYNNSLNKIDNQFIIHTNRSQKQNYNVSKFIKKKSNELIQLHYENSTKVNNKNLNNTNINSVNVNNKNVKNSSYQIKKQQCIAKIQNKDKQIKIIQPVKNNLEELMHSTQKQFLRNNSPAFTQDSVKTSNKSEQDHKVALDSFKYYLFNYQGQQNSNKNDKKYQQPQINNQQINVQQATRQYRDQFVLDTIEQTSDDQSQKSIRHMYV